MKSARNWECSLYPECLWLAAKNRKNRLFCQWCAFADDEIVFGTEELRGCALLLAAVFMPEKYYYLNHVRSRPGA